MIYLDFISAMNITCFDLSCVRWKYDFHVWELMISATSNSARIYSQILLLSTNNKKSWNITTLSSFDTSIK